jgi:hypothetical protein
MKFHISYPSLFLSLITLTSSSLAKEQDRDYSSRSAVLALTTPEIGLSIPSLSSIRAGVIGKIEDDDTNKPALATLTITADLQPTLLATPHPPNPNVVGLIGDIDLNKLSGSSSSTFLNDRDFQSAVLNSTNTIRQQHNATSLLWNTTLVSYAQNWSERCRPKKSVNISSDLKAQSQTYSNDS